MLGKLRENLPSLPRFTSQVEIPVYMIHMDAGPNDYFFLFDFESFAEKSKKGLFVRPVLKIWAGRDDFSRRQFAADFKETFQREFEQMRRDVNPKQDWWAAWFPSFGWADSDDFAPIAAVFNLAILVMWVALLGPKILVSLRTLFWGKKRLKDVEAKIAELRDQVNDVLETIDVSLHPELYERARELHGPVQRSRVDEKAWPLPEYARNHLNQGRSGSWW